MGSLSPDCNEFRIIPFEYICDESTKEKISDENYQNGKEREKKNVINVSKQRARDTTGPTTV